MTITDLIPRRKGHGRRRAADKADELRDENIKLLTRQAAADDYFALLTQDRDDVYACWNEERRKRHEAEEIVVAQLASIDELRAENDRLHAEVTALRAAAANATAVTVPPATRDTSAIEDQATAPIDVRPLWDAHGIRAVTDPGRTA